MNLFVEGQVDYRVRKALADRHSAMYSNTSGKSVRPVKSELNQQKFWNYFWLLLFNKVLNFN